MERVRGRIWRQAATIVALAVAASATVATTQSVPEARATYQIEFELGGRTTDSIRGIVVRAKPNGPARTVLLNVAATNQGTADAGIWASVVPVDSSFPSVDSYAPGKYALPDGCATTGCQLRYAIEVHLRDPGAAARRVVVFVEVTSPAADYGDPAPPIDLSIDADPSLDRNVVPHVLDAELAGDVSNSVPRRTVRLHVPAAAIPRSVYPIAGAASFCTTATDSLPQMALTGGSSVAYLGCDVGVDWLRQCEQGRDCDVTFVVWAFQDSLSAEFVPAHWTMTVRLESLDPAVPLPDVPLQLTESP